MIKSISHIKIIILFLGFFSLCTASYGQRKYFADKFFKEYAYKKSAELYKQIYKKGDRSVFILRRLGDSYYYNGETEEAEKWYGLLKNSYGKRGRKDSLYVEYLFRYAQVLKGNGKYKESDECLLKLRKIRPTDSSGKSLASNLNYFSKIKENKNIYVTIHNVIANTKYSDFGTFIRGEEVFFSSSRSIIKGNSQIYKWNRQPFLNLYKAKRRLVKLEIKNKRIVRVNELDSTDVHKLVGDINTKYHEASGIITKDGKTIYFTRNSYKGSKKNTVNLKLYKSTFRESQWKNIQELPFNNSNYSVGHPALSPDEKTLYFASNMPGGYGLTDIYKVSILGNNTFGTPKNLGKGINTERREMFPYVDSKGTLYFSSDGHIGLGGLDIFKSVPKNNNYLTAINLALPFNSQKDDFSFVFDKLNTSGYFSSNRKGGKGDDDIYSFTTYKCTEFIEGFIRDRKTGEVLLGASVRLVDSKGKVLSRVLTDKSGKYVFKEVSCNTLYTVIGDKKNYKSDKKEVSTLLVDRSVVKLDLTLIPLVIKNQIVIDPIYFDYNKYNIREDAKYELENIIDVMKANMGMIIKIESHTDSRGNKSYNKILSDRRAKSTRDYIISRGISADRIESAIGYGESHLLNNCDDAHQKKCTEAEHQINRRSYFYIIKKEVAN